FRSRLCLWLAGPRLALRLFGRGLLGSGCCGLRAFRDRSRLRRGGYGFDGRAHFCTGLNFCDRRWSRGLDSCSCSCSRGRSTGLLDAVVLVLIAAIATATTAATTTAAAGFAVCVGSRGGVFRFFALFIGSFGFGVGNSLDRDLGCSRFGALTIAATTAATTAAAARRFSFAVLGGAGTLFGLCDVLVGFDLFLFSIAFDDGTVDTHVAGCALIGIGGNAGLTLLDRELVASQLAVRRDGDRQTIARLERGEGVALEIEDIERDVGRHANIDRLALLAQDVVLDVA